MRLPVLAVLASLLLAGCATEQPEAADPTPARAPDATPSPVSGTPPASAPTAPSPAQPTSSAPTVPKGPSWTFTSVEGETVTRDEPAGEATVMFFMATWCSSCRSKAPLMRAIHEDYADKGVRMLSVDFDASESKSQIRDWQQRYDHPWPHGIDEGLRLQRLFEVRSQSSVVVLDGNGNVVENFGYGRVNEAGLRDALDRALAA